MISDAHIVALLRVAPVEPLERRRDLVGRDVQVALGDAGHDEGLDVLAVLGDLGVSLFDDQIGRSAPSSATHGRGGRRGPTIDQSVAMTPRTHAFRLILDERVLAAILLLLDGRRAEDAAGEEGMGVGREPRVVGAATLDAERLGLHLPRHELDDAAVEAARGSGQIGDAEGVSDEGKEQEGT